MSEEPDFCDEIGPGVVLWGTEHQPFRAGHDLGTPVQAGMRCVQYLTGCLLALYQKRPVDGQAVNARSRGDSPIPQRIGVHDCRQGDTLARVRIERRTDPVTLPRVLKRIAPRDTSWSEVSHSLENWHHTRVDFLSIQRRERDGDLGQIKVAEEICGCELRERRVPRHCLMKRWPLTPVGLEPTQGCRQYFGEQGSRLFPEQERDFVLIKLERFGQIGGVAVTLWGFGQDSRDCLRKSGLAGLVRGPWC